jgi:predicted N-acetyltransferase YhbS
VIAAILEDVRQWLAARGIVQWTRPFSPDWIAARIDAGELHVARRDGEPVAVVRLLWADPLFWGQRERGDAAYLHTLAVRRDRAGEGIGGAVVRWAEERARACGRSFLRVDCAAENQALGAYYQRLGFTPVGPVTVGGEKMMLFEKALAG